MNKEEDPWLETQEAFDLLEAVLGTAEADKLFCSAMKTSLNVDTRIQTGTTAPQGEVWIRYDPGRGFQMQVPQVRKEVNDEQDMASGDAGSGG